jgi:hypothetical protein
MEGDRCRKNIPQSKFLQLEYWVTSKSSHADTERGQPRVGVGRSSVPYSQALHRVPPLQPPKLSIIIAYDPVIWKYKNSWTPTGGVTSSIPNAICQPSISRRLPSASNPSSLMSCNCRHDCPYSARWDAQKEKMEPIHSAPESIGHARMLGSGLWK